MLLDGGICDNPVDILLSRESNIARIKQDLPQIRHFITMWLEPNGNTQRRPFLHMKVDAMHPGMANLNGLCKQLSAIDFKRFEIRINRNRLGILSLHKHTFKEKNDIPLDTA